MMSQVLKHTSSAEYLRRLVYHQCKPSQSTFIVVAGLVSKLTYDAVSDVHWSIKELEFKYSPSRRRVRSSGQIPKKEGTTQLAIVRVITNAVS